MEALRALAQLSTAASRGSTGEAAHGRRLAKKPKGFTEKGWSKYQQVARRSVNAAEEYAFPEASNDALDAVSG